MRRYLALFLAASTAAVAACGDTLSPGNASDEDRADILSLLDETDWFTESFGVDGVAEDQSVSMPLGFAAAVAAPQNAIDAVRRWGRRRGQPVVRERRIEVQGDTAHVTFTLSFEGSFLFDPADDGVDAPVRKPANETVVQHALLVRRSRDDAAGHRWRVVAASPREWMMTDESLRTIAITRIQIDVNGEQTLVIEDPAALLRVGDRLPLFEMGDAVRVAVRVENTTGTGNEPEEFVFLHLVHASPTSRHWLRLPMVRNDAGEYVREWTVRLGGRARMVVDAIDSGAFDPASEDYRAHEVGIPYVAGRDHRISDE